MKIHEKIYANLGRGFSDHFLSKDLDKSFSSEISSLASYKGNNVRFIYKNINSKYVFVQSVPLSNDSFNRGGMFLSHYVILDTEDNLNPAAYINSSVFLTEDVQVVEKKSTIKSLKKNAGLEIDSDPIVFFVVDCLIKAVSEGNKLVYVSENDDLFNNLLFSAFSMLPDFLVKEVSFSVGVEKFNKENLCDINFTLPDVVINKKNYLYKLNNIKVINLDDVVLGVLSRYSSFVKSIPEAERLKYFHFILKSKSFSLSNISKSVNVYLINSMGVYKVKTEENILETVLSITSVSSLYRFIDYLLTNEVVISSSYLRKLDLIVYEKFHDVFVNVSIKKYLRFISNVSLVDCKYYIKRYGFLKEGLFFYFLCGYELDGVSFVNLVKSSKFDDSRFLMFCLDNKLYKKVFFLFEWKLLSLYRSKNILSFCVSKEDKAIEIIDEFLDVTNDLVLSEKKIYLKGLIDATEKTPELLMYFVCNNFLLMDDFYISELSEIIESKYDEIKLKGSSSSSYIFDFLDAVDLSSYSGLYNLKYEKIMHSLSCGKLNESNLDRVLRVIKEVESDR